MIKESPRQYGGPSEVTPTPDPVAERHNQALNLNKDGLAYFNSRDWAKAVDRFREALKKWPDNIDIRTNLNSAEFEWWRQTDKEKRDDRRNLGNALTEQEKIDSRNELKKDLQNQEAAQARRNLKSELEQQAIAQKKQARIDGLLEEIKKDQNAIRNLGLYDQRNPEKRAKDFEAWAQLSEKTKVEHEKEVLEALLQAIEVAVTQSIVAGAGKAIKPAQSLNPWNVNTQIKWFESKGVNDPIFFDAMRAVAKTPGKPEMVKKLLERMHVVAEVVLYSGKTHGSEGKGAENAHELLNGLALVLGIIDPKYKLLVADLRFTAASVYNNAAQWESHNQINSLTKLTEEQLKLLDKLDRRLVSHVKQLNLEKRELARLSAGN